MKINQKIYGRHALHSEGFRALASRDVGKNSTIRIRLKNKNNYKSLKIFEQLRKITQNNYIF